MTPRKWHIIEILLVFLLMLTAFLLGTFYTELPAAFSFADSTPAKAVTNCSNMDLQETAYCLRDYVATFYNYTVRADTDKTLEDIKEHGGDCYDYSLLYTKLAKSAGYNSTVLTFQVGGDNTLMHAIVTLTDPKYGYCIIDQISNPWCVVLSFPSTTEQNTDPNAPAPSEEATADD